MMYYISTGRAREKREIEINAHKYCLLPAVDQPFDFQLSTSQPNYTLNHLSPLHFQPTNYNNQNEVHHVLCSAGCHCYCCTHR